MKISAWVQHPLVRRNGIFVSRISRGVTIGLFGLSIHLGPGPFGFDWQGFDSKRFKFSPANG
jgi:hypothetical protein